MLMDEPFGAVDPIVRERLQDEFLRIHRELRTTVLMVTHDIDEAIKLGDHVAVMQEGGILAQYAAPTELLTRPANDFVARFVGADRGLKRLALTTVGDLELSSGETVRLGELGLVAAQRARAAGAAEVLLVDAERRPLGWLRVDQLTSQAAVSADGVNGELLAFDFDTSLRDALSTLLSVGANSGIVVGSDGRYRGLVSIESIAAAVSAAQPAQNLAPTGEPTPWDR
jgi:osmoprotectant transport system ATP-binding protein